MLLYAVRVRVVCFLPQLRRQLLTPRGRQRPGLRRQALQHTQDAFGCQSLPVFADFVDDPAFSHVGPGSRREPYSQALPSEGLSSGAIVYGFKENGAAVCLVEDVGERVESAALPDGADFDRTTVLDDPLSQPDVGAVVGPAAAENALRGPLAYALRSEAQPGVCRPPSYASDGPDFDDVLPVRCALRPARL